MTIGKPGEVITRERTNMSDRGLARAVEVGILVEIWEPTDSAADAVDDVEGDSDDRQDDEDRDEHDG